MNEHKKTYKITSDMIPGQAFHPGELLFDEIEYRGISQKELAAKMNISPTIMNEIIHGKRNLTAALAIKLEKALDIDAIMWMRLQVKYDIDSLKIKERDKMKNIPKMHSQAIPYQDNNTISLTREPKVKFRKRKEK